MIKELVSTLSSSPQSNGLRLDADRLDSWKEIASYFRREVRTVQLWEKREGLPVHRHFHKQLGSVFAFRSELDAWNERVSQKGCEPLGSVRSPEAKPAPGHITIRVERFRKRVAGEQAVCDAIEARTIAALEQLNPRLLSVELASSTAEADCNGKASPESASQKPPSGYLLRWGIQDHAGGLRVNAQLLA